MPPKMPFIDAEDLEMSNALLQHMQTFEEFYFDIVWNGVH